MRLPRHPRLRRRRSSRQARRRKTQGAETRFVVLWRSEALYGTKANSGLYLVQKSESEMSVLEDDPPPQKRKKKADGGVGVYSRLLCVAPC